jgi:pimeloyl-ACP methyl ester carboxylesterase
MLVRYFLLLLIAVTLVSKTPAEPVAPPAESTPEALALARGPNGVRFFLPDSAVPIRAGVLFGSGDGGWSSWEERVCRHLLGRGFAVAGIDFRAYAAEPYNVEQLREDYRRIAAELRRRSGPKGVESLLYGGWSMGAEQAIPAAARRSARPAGLLGFLMVAPGGRGRYGLELPDQLGLAPRGEDTFSLNELAPASADLRFAVFHGSLDLVDDLDWQRDLSLDYRLWTVPRVFHDFAGAGVEFLAAMNEALDWLLDVAKPPKK